MCEQGREIAELFEAMAKLLEIQGANHHRIWAYRRAAETLRNLDTPLSQIWREGALESLPGIGAILAAKIDEYLRTGHLAAYDKLQDQVPLGLLDILDLPGIGPRRVQRLWHELGITSMEELEAAISARQLRQIKGFTPRLETSLRAAIRSWHRQRAARIPLTIAWPLSQEICAALLQVSGVLDAQPYGSVRRMRETVGDLGVLAATDTPEPALARFRTLPLSAEVVLSEPRLARIRTVDGLLVTLRIVSPAEWGSALQYFTGSQAHNVQLRTLALARGLTFSEHGFYPPEENGPAQLYPCATEKAVYAKLDLPWIPPELRESHGEIEAAQAGQLPRLVTRADILGDLQSHTSWADGEHSIQAMAQAAAEAGLRYLCITDHAVGKGMRHGLVPRAVSAYREVIAQANERSDVQLLAGVEVGICEDGSLEWPDDLLAQMDFVVATLYAAFDMPTERMTARLVSALDNPHVDMLALPSEARGSHREPLMVDFDALFQALARANIALGLNAYPQRMGLNAEYVRRAVQLGVKLGIGSTAHDREGVALLELGVALARRGWATAEHVLNTMTFDELRTWQRARRGSSPPRRGAHGKDGKLPAG